MYGADVLMSSIGVGDPVELWRQEAQMDTAATGLSGTWQVSPRPYNIWQICFD